MTWHALHVYYYDRSGHDRLLLDAVRPLCQTLTPDVGRAYFLRHWRQGPHLRLNVDTEPATFDSVVRPAAAETIGSYLRQHPSTLALDPAALRSQHERQAEQEQDDGPLHPWFPDNSVSPARYDDRAAVLGSEQAADLLADYYTATTGFVFDVMARTPPGPARVQAAFDMVVTTARGTEGGGLAGSFMSLRSHAEAFLASGAGATQRPVWEQRYARDREALAARVRAIDAMLGTGPDAASVAGQWAAALAPFQARAADLVQRGQVGLTAPAPGDDDAPGGLSPFHQALAGAQWWPRLLASAEFGTYRIMINFTYLQLTRLGIAPATRFFLCYLASRVAEDSYGVSADAALAGPEVPSRRGPRPFSQTTAKGAP